MQAEIINGQLRVTPSNSTESYALEQWRKNNFLDVTDMDRMEVGRYRASNLVLGTVGAKESEPCK